MEHDSETSDRGRPETILGVVCSPRRLGNCELIIKEISARLSTPHRLKLLRLPRFQIHPCNACYTCLQTGQCCLEDDLHAVLEAMCKADALVVAAPTYFLGPPACLKSFLDRGLSFYSHADSLWGKPALGAIIAGIPGKEGYTKLGVESFLKCLLADIRSSGVFYGALPGEILQDEGNLERIAEFGAALEGGRSESEGFCPVCGGDTFRFLSPDRVRCMLCSNEGDARRTEDGIALTVRSGEHEIFTDRETALGHADWLRGMKERFKDKKRELLSLSKQYKDVGEWIEPG